jgi:hypothetical protein
MATTDTQSTLSVQGISAEGTAPKRRIATLSAAMTANNSMLQAYRQGGRDVRFATIAGMFAGFPPIPPPEMEKMGMGDMPNFNTRGFESKVMGFADVWNSLNCQNPQWMEVQAEHEDPMEAERRSKVLTENANWALGVWEDPPKDGFFNQSGKYVLESAVRDVQMGLFGIGVCMRRDPIDFRFTTIPTRNFRVPTGVKITLENCPAVCIDDDMSASQLWQLRSTKGWSKEEICRVLYLNQGARGLLDNTRSTYAQWVEWARENESFILNDFEVIPFVHILVQEFNGRISHLCFSPTNPGMDKEQKNYDPKGVPQGTFLYDAPESDWAHSWAQAVHLFSDTVGPEGRYHGIKGFGDRNLDMSDGENLTLNRAIMGAIVTNTPMFINRNEGDRQRLNQVTITPFGILAPELELAQVPIKADVGSMVSIFDLIGRTQNTNNRKFPMGETTSSGEARTATEINTDTAKEAEFTGLQISFYRSTGLDPTLAETYRRLAQPGSKYPESWKGGKVAKEFRERCKKAGIPEDDLLKVKLVRANRSGGSGSMAIDVMKAEKLLSVATPGKGQWNARYELACALKGHELAKSFVEPIPELPDEISRVIDTDNLFIKDGKVRAALPNDPHEVHVPSHLQLGAELQQVVMQLLQIGVNPQNLDDAILLQGKLEACVAHTGQHLQYMQELPTGKGKRGLYDALIAETTKGLTDLQQMAQMLAKDIEKAAQEKQKAEAPQDPEMAKAQAKIQIMYAEAEARIKIAEAAAVSKINNLNTQHLVRTGMKQASHEVDLGLKAEKTLADMQQQQAKSAEQMALEAEKGQMELSMQGATSAIKLMETAKAAEIKNEPKPTSE